jgi:hypothetical protein
MLCQYIYLGFDESFLKQFFAYRGAGTNQVKQIQLFNYGQNTAIYSGTIRYPRKGVEMKVSYQTIKEFLQKLLETDPCWTLFGNLVCHDCDDHHKGENK